MKKAKKLLSMLLTLAMIIGIFSALSPAAFAATPEQLKATIEAYSSGGLIAVVDGSTVTVTGSVTGATAGLTLNIDAGVTVVWKAALFGSTTGTSSNALMNISGNNANLDGKYKFADDHDLAGYTLFYDIKGNGSSIKVFKLF